MVCGRYGRTPITFSITITLLVQATGFASVITLRNTAQAHGTCTWQNRSKMLHFIHTRFPQRFRNRFYDASFFCLDFCTKYHVCRTVRDALRTYWLNTAASSVHSDSILTILYVNKPTDQSQCAFGKIGQQNRTCSILADEIARQQNRPILHDTWTIYVGR